MSDALTPEAPEAVEAAAAPPAAEAVEVGSVDSTEVIPKERFNGLMSTYNREKAAWEAEREAMLAENERLSEAGTESDVSDEVLTELQALRQELLNEKLSNARKAAIEKYPGAKPLADLIIGNSPDEIEAMAAEISSRLEGLTAPAGAPEADASGEVEPAPAAAAPVAPQVGGAAAFDADATVDDEMHAALDSKDFGAFLRAAAQRAENSQGNAELTVG